MNILNLTIGSCFFLCSLFANVGPQGFFNYPNEYFVETGTSDGSGLAKALLVGFKELRSIEIDPLLAAKAKQRFSNNRNIKILCGDSAKDLWELIKDIEAPITFWLDGHNVFPVVGKKNCPLLEELDQIKNHPIKNHTILIDDMHCLGTLHFDYLSRETLIAKIKEINPQYQITYVLGGDYGSHPNNILVAKISEGSKNTSK